MFGTKKLMAIFPYVHNFRWSNPVLDRLTGGMGNHILANQQHKQNGISHAAAANGLRNDSYYMATNDTWSPMGKNNSVLIEDDSDPLAPYVTSLFWCF